MSNRSSQSESSSTDAAQSSPPKKRLRSSTTHQPPTNTDAKSKALSIRMEARIKSISKGLQSSTTPYPSASSTNIAAAVTGSSWPRNRRNKSKSVGLQAVTDEKKDTQRPGETSKMQCSPVSSPAAKGACIDNPWDNRKFHSFKLASTFLTILRMVLYI